MARKQNEPPKAPATLTQDLDQAKAILADRIRLGQELFNRHVNYGGEMEVAGKEFKKWADYNVAMLGRMFTTDEEARAYEWAGAGSIQISFGDFPSPVEEFNGARAIVKEQTEYLESLLNRIDLLAPTSPGLAPTARRSLGALTAADQSHENPSRVFIVHGQSDAVRESVARVLQNAGIQPIILHEQANRGDTIIEKFERNADVHFAVVLLTGDDEGRRKGDTNPLKLRARQNVILELGYFVARLGRQRVCALYEHGVEIPSDWNGVVYVPLDAGGSWKFQLAKELKAVGFTIDMNKL